MLHKVVTMCYIVCDRCAMSSPAEHNKRDAVWAAKQCGWKAIKGAIVCDECQRKAEDENAVAIQNEPTKTKRINHRKLHRELEAEGYSVFVLDYAEGAHHYQIEKNDPHEWHEYGVRATKEGKFVDLTGVGKELYERIVKYYEEQGVTAK